MIYLFIVFFWALYFLLNKNLSFLYVLPGTIAHEFSHFIIGLISFGNPSSFSLIPKKEGGGFVLGSVSFSNIRFFNAIPIALAPLLLLIAAFSALKASVGTSITEQLMWGFIIFNLVFSSKPSSADFKVILSKPFGILFYLVIIMFFIGGQYDFKIFINLYFNKFIWN